MTNANQIDMTEGPILPKLLRFSVPLIVSSLLQLLFNAADIVVVGRFAGDESLAAVGSTTAIINMLINLFTGLAVGTNVVAAHFFGAKKHRELKDTVSTAMVVSVYSGLALTVIGIVGADLILRLMQSPAAVRRLSSLYLKIYFAGITATMIYNFGSALLRAKGDTQRPLYILLLAGVVNLMLNLVFVILFRLDVAGVALATVISQCISAALIVVLLVKDSDEFHLDFRRLRVSTRILAQIVRIGVPAGFQGIMFSFSNVIIQSFVNSFGPVVIAGNSAASNLEGFIYTSMNGFSQGTLTFCSQNLGAGKICRIRKVVLISQGAIVVIGGALSALFLVFGHQLLGIFSESPEVIEAGMRRLAIVLTTYYLCGMMDAMANSVRSIGHSLLPVLVTLIGACAFRILWLFTMFRIPRFQNTATIYFSYPISWVLTLVAHTICFVIAYRKLRKSRDSAL